MGYLFKPPPKRSKQLWEVMKILSEYGFKYDKAGNVAFINSQITGHNKQPPTTVRKNINELLKKKNAHK
jgi:hypothetical protein